MTRDDTPDALPEDRDPRVGPALGELDVPDYPPDFLANVWARIDEEAGTVPAAGTARARPRRWFWTRRPLLAGVAAAAIAAGAAAAFLFGLPGASDKTGPPPVSAAVVVQSAQRALASARTLVADCTTSDWGLANWMTPDSVPVRGNDHMVTRFRLTLRADGSYRQTLVPMTLKEAMRLARAGTRVRGLEYDTAYDAATSVRRSYSRGSATWAGDFSTEAVFTDARVTTGCVPDQPDLLAQFYPGRFDFAVGGFMRALPAVAGGDARPATYEGRPVWIVTAHLPLLWEMWELSGTRSWSLKGPAIDRLAVTVDQQTRLPLRTQAWYRGVLFSETRLENARVNVALPSNAFTLVFPPGTKVFRHDMGFRSVSLGGAAARVGHDLFVPTKVPAGCTLSQVAVGPEADSQTGSRAPQETGVVSLRYARGFDAVIVTTRRVERPKQFAQKEALGYLYGTPSSGSFSVPQGGYVPGPAVVRLTAGALARSYARLVTGPLIVPHLWAVKGHLLLTIAGAATTDELVAMANSMKTYQGSEEATP